MSSRAASVASRLASTTASSSSIRPRRVTGGVAGASAGGTATAAGDATTAGRGPGAGGGVGAGADLAPSSATTLRLYSLSAALSGGVSVGCCQAVAPVFASYA